MDLGRPVVGGGGAVQVGGFHSQAGITQPPAPLIQARVKPVGQHAGCYLLATTAACAADYGHYDGIESY